MKNKKKNAPADASASDAGASEKCHLQNTGKSASGQVAHCQKMRRTYGMDRKGMANLSTLRTTAELAHGGVPKMMEYYDADYVANATYKERYEIEEEESHDDKGTCKE